MAKKVISKSMLSRLPKYLSYLRSLSDDAPANISATMIASALDMGEVQVRKDLAVVSRRGKPKIGYQVCDLINSLESFLGYKEVQNAVVVGAGRLGSALLGYNGFKEYGINIVAAFDSDQNNIGKTIGSSTVYNIDNCAKICKEFNATIGIITVPDTAAQQVVDQLVGAGIKAIMNFAPTHIRVPKDVILNNENIATSLALLSLSLKDKLKNTQNKNAEGE